MNPTEGVKVKITQLVAEIGYINNRKLYIGNGSQMKVPVLGNTELTTQ